MWKYIKSYLHYAIIAALFMVGEVMMDLIQPSMMTKIVDEGVLGLHHNGAGNFEQILYLGIVMILLVILGGLCGSLNNVFVHISSQNIGNEIRKACFQKMMTFSFSQLDSFGTGSLVTRVTNDITQVQNFIAQFVRGMIRTSMLMLGSIYFMFRLNRHFGVIVLCVFPWMIACMFICLRKASPLLTKMQEELDQINHILQEDISGIRIIKSCVKESYEKLRFGKAQKVQIRTQLKVLFIFALMNPVMNALMNTTIVMILYAGFYQVGSQMTTPGSVMAAITYTTQLLNAILMLVMLFQNISRGIASWRRVQEVLSSQTEIEDGNFEGTTEERGLIEFDDVSFAFPRTNKTVLAHINLKIKPGETIAIMGATGCGKSTLVSLIVRFYDVTSGSVKIDGIDVREYQLKALRDKVAISLQKNELFSTTIKENIRWGQVEAKDDAIIEAAKIAQAHDFIENTPDGYETMVAEAGMSLSGGQKQRISIARTVLKPSEILILDDASSALDLKTEADLYQALNQAKPKATKILIAQRISSVRHADRILVLNNGSIEACGSHEQLMQISQTYQDIYYSQIGNEGELYERIKKR